MNIYFACSITGGRDYEKTYQAFTHALLEDGHDIPTAHLAGSNVVSLEKVVEPRDVYTRDVNWIRACNVLIAEVSVPSHGVGYEIGYALEYGKRVLCLAHAGRPVSKMITGNPHPALKFAFYGTVEEGIEIIRGFIKS
jgi:hypothetical protein